MNVVLLGLATTLLVVGIVSAFWSRRYLTETGRNRPWYQQLSPVWTANPNYTPVGQRLVRVSGITACLGAIIYLAVRLAH